MADRLKPWLVRKTPARVLRMLHETGLVQRTTVFRWEMNVLLGEWQSNG